MAHRRIESRRLAIAVAFCRNHIQHRQIAAVYWANASNQNNQNFIFYFFFILNRLATVTSSRNFEKRKTTSAYLRTSFRFVAILFWFSIVDKTCFSTASTLPASQKFVKQMTRPQFEISCFWSKFFRCRSVNWVKLSTANVKPFKMELLASSALLSGGPHLAKAS